MTTAHIPPVFVDSFKNYRLFLKTRYIYNKDNLKKTSIYLFQRQLKKNFYISDIFPSFTQCYQSVGTTTSNGSLGTTTSSLVALVLPLPTASHFPPQDLISQHVFLQIFTAHQ